jgi:glutamine cyclotransferase
VNRNRIPDSVIISFNGSRLALLKSGTWSYQVPAAAVISTGKKALKATAWKEGKAQSVTRFIEIYSSVTPPMLGYKVVNTFPHSRDAFTQGLFFDNGYLYEGTGQESGSSLREVELTTGKVLRQVNLESTLFGEGITLLGDMIFQVTWENKVGFVYEKSTFRLLRKIYYPTQGWGLTTIGNRIVMSDGSNVLYYYEPEMFTVASRLEVYDNEGPVESLNELEYIDGEIWANIWMKDKIARIDPSSGQVLAYIELTGLLPEADRDPETDVLNGIAYDGASKRIFVTGKKWPKLFEIRVRE